jgi:stage V sporulation protein SpoVS
VSTVSLTDAPARASGALGLLRTRVLGAPAVSRKRKAVALAVAFAADLVQLVLWPAFAEGAASPFDDALDAVVALVLLLTLGVSGRLVLALALELVPGADLFPTWSAVVASIPTGDEPVVRPAEG